VHREIIAVRSEINTKHINTLCGQNVEFFNVKFGGTYSDHWALKGNIRTLLFFPVDNFEEFFSLNLRDCF
jgi:hypothetical protein